MQQLRKSEQDCIGPRFTTQNDAGSGSLHEAIANAVDGKTITFNFSFAGDTIFLHSGEITIADKNLIIDATAAGMPITITTTNSSRIFTLDDSYTVFRATIY